MKYKKTAIVIISVLLLAGVGYYLNNNIIPVQELLVKSNDGRVELSFSKNDLPKGISESDISIKKIDIENASKEIRAFYSFKPDGLVFNQPVTATFHTDYDPDSTSMLFHVVGKNIEPVHNLGISANKEKTEQIVVAAISSFSNYVLIDGIFGVSSVDPGVRRVGEIFFEPINVRYPNTPDITFSGRIPDTDDTFTWKVRLEKQFVSGIWNAFYIYDPTSAIDSPPSTEISGGSFNYQKEFRCVSPGEGFIIPDVYLYYQYHLLDENNNQGPLFSDIATVKLRLNGNCIMPGTENLDAQTTCGGSVNINGNLNKYNIETDKVKVFIKKAGTSGSFVSFDDANYTISGGKFTYTTELPPGKYEYGISAVMIGAYTNFPVSERHEFDILPCPEKKDTIPKLPKDPDTTPKVNDTDPYVNSDGDADVGTKDTPANSTTDSCDSPGVYGFPVYDSSNLPNDCRAPANSSGWDCYTFEDARCNPETRCFCITPPEYIF